MNDHDENHDGELDLTNPARGGVFFVVEEDLDGLSGSARDHGQFSARISLEGCEGKATLLERLQAGLSLPATFGHNWDALTDAMRDLSWIKAPGYVILFDHAQDLREGNQDDFDTLLDILDEAAEEWLDQGIPFFAFFALPESAFDDPDY
ncbi:MULTISPECIES: barstar family protein [Dyella]|uniref:Barnase inhibitor n=2 Tax=Dyella TaxID=231454 RepID=A0A4R0Z1K2_9GAMM|nr:MULTISPECIES: barstar family protein [Dyella]TBR38925.1 barnase inhibitor [Dyella terrae]TCI13484.1 barnase inhibitor [Dyella soli]